MMIADHDIYWLKEPDSFFLKKIGVPHLEQIGQIG